MPHDDVASREIEVASLRDEVSRLQEALAKTLAYTERLKKERAGARAENAALKSKLADAHLPAPASVVDALAKALQHPQGANLLDPDLVLDGLTAAQRARLDAEERAQLPQPERVAKAEEILKRARWGGR